MYKFVEDKSYLKQTYGECADIVNQLKQELKKYGIESQMNVVGSYKRNMVTQNGKGSIDFDFNLLIEEAQRFRERDLKETIREALNEVLRRNGWEDSDDSRTALTIRPKNYRKRKIPFTVDICIVKRDFHGQLHRLKHMKTGFVATDQYFWNAAPYSSDLKMKEEALKPDYWQEVRDTYLDKKDMYLTRNDKEHPSFVCYIEAVNEVYNKHVSKGVYMNLMIR